jgi:hypothetical protein
MFVAEVWAGLAAGSSSLQADAMDFFGDAANYAISLGVAGMAKMSPALFLAGVAMAGRWRAFVAAGLTAVALSVLALPLVGMDAQVRFYAEVLPGFELVGWYGIAGPAKMPKPLVSRLNTELLKFLAMPDVRERILADGSEPVGNDPETFRKYMLADMIKWAKLVKESGAKL